MNDVELLLKSIESEPDDLTAVACLTDALMEERDMNRSEAERYAEHVVQAVRDARDLKEAARILEADQPWHRELLNDLLYHCCLTADTDAQVIVVPGERAPSFAHVEHTFGGGWWTSITVTVGAGWVIGHFRRNPSLCAIVRASIPAQPQRKRKSR